MSGVTTTSTSVLPASPGPPCLAPSPNDISAAQIQPSGTNASLSGHVIPDVRNGKAAYRVKLPQSQTIRMELVFAIRNLQQFQSCLVSIHDPHSPNYGHFLDATTLSPYVPTPGQKASVVSFLSRRGFNVTNGASPLVLVMSAHVKDIEATLGVRINLYSIANSSFYGVDADPSLPRNFASIVNGIMGLDNYTVTRPAESPCSGPYCPQGIQVGYSLSSLYTSGYDGTGQKVAIVDVPGDPNMQTAINTFDSQYGLASTTLDIRYLDGCCSSYDPGWASETAMDVEAVHSVAPGAGIILLYDQVSLMNAIDYVATNHLATIVSNSWVYVCTSGNCNDAQLPSSFVSSVDSRLALDSSQGLTILFASGDAGAKPDGTNLGTQFPASDPNVLAVGATNLVLSGCTSTTCSGYSSESGASISGGGYSGYFAEPSWQTSTIGSKSGRAVPDVSMLGWSPGFWVYSTASDKCGAGGNSAGWFGCAGTSLSTPLWAGFLVIALQMRNGVAFGNIGPKLYQAASSQFYSSYFHDVTSGFNNGYSAGTGWDPVTGWGSPIASSLAQAFYAFDFRLYNSGSSSNLGGITVARGSSGSITITVSLVNGPAQTVTLSCSQANGSPLPSGVSCSSASGTPPFTRTLTVTVSSSAPPGRYTIKVTGRAGSLTRITLFTLNVT